MNLTHQLEHHTPLGTHTSNDRGVSRIDARDLQRRAAAARARHQTLLQARSQGRLVGRLRSTRRVELWDDNLVIPPALAACAAVLAFVDELMHLRLPDEFNSQWFSPRGRDLAAAHQLPRAEAALRQEL
jgi:hypothetical protein